MGAFEDSVCDSSSESVYDNDRLNLPRFGFPLLKWTCFLHEDNEDIIVMIMAINK